MEKDGREQMKRCAARVEHPFGTMKVNKSQHGLAALPHARARKGASRNECANADLPFSACFEHCRDSGV